MLRDPDNGPMNIWCEFGKDPIETKGYEAQTRKTNLAPLMAKTGTAES